MACSLGGIHTRLCNFHTKSHAESDWRSTRVKSKMENVKAQGALTARLSSCLRNLARQSASADPMRSSTQRAFLKPRSTALSSVHATPDLLRSASGFRNARSVLLSSIRNTSRQRTTTRPRILATISERSGDVNPCGFLELKAVQFG